MLLDQRNRPTVLVMDDAPEHREYAKVFLESEGYRVNLASTMKGAITAIHNGQDLMVALIDIHMGGDVALEVFGYIQRTASHRVVGYAWTGDTRQATHLDAVRAGAFRVFNKGLDSDELILEYMKSDIELVRAYGEDDLTGLYNTRSFRRAALEDLKTMRDHGQPGVASLVFIDIDDFKLVNDEHGHLVGDDAIRAIGRAARAHVRPGDHLCRKGGDEFLIMTPGLGGDYAVLRAARIQSTIAATTVSDKDGRTVALSVSVGVADVRAGDLGDDLEMDLNGLIDRADEGKNADKLTKARRRGRAVY